MTQELKKTQGNCGWGDTCVHYIDCGNGFMSIYECHNCSIIQLKHVQFITCQLNFNKVTIK